MPLCHLDVRCISTKRDLTDLERDVRGIMRENRSWYYNQAVERFHLPLAEGGLGLLPLVCVHDASIVSLAIVKQTEGDQFISGLRRGLEWMTEHVPTRRTLYQMAGKILGEPVNTIGAVLPKAASYREEKLSSLREALARKVVHGKYGFQMRSENAFLWLPDGRVDAQTSALVMAAQVAAIRTGVWQTRFVAGTDRCRVCANGRETVGHIIAMCQPHQWTMYKPKHDEVARCIQWSVARALDLIAQSESRTVPDVVHG